MPEVGKEGYEGQNRMRGYFKVDLGKNAELDIELFDEMAKELAHNDDQGNYELGVIIASDTMFLFSGDASYTRMLNNLFIDWEIRFSKKLYSARIKIDNQTSERVIYGNVQFNDVRLSLSDSDAYKHTLASVLGPAFKVI